MLHINLLFTIMVAGAVSDADYMSRVMRKHVFGVSDQVRHKLNCTATEDGYMLEVEGVYYMYTKTKALISSYPDVTREVHTNFKMTLSILVKFQLFCQF